MSNDKQSIDYSSVPDRYGHYGPYGGRYVSETLISALDELDATYQKLRTDSDFLAEFDKD